jgi:hypothetical protein
MKKLIPLFFILFISNNFASNKVLYFTHEPGKYHKYSPQKKVFIDIAKKAGWDLTVSTGDHDGQILKLRDKNLSKGYDVVVYNMCFAGSNDLEAVSNVIAQTREKGTPAMLIHCAMHCFFGTYRNGVEGAIGPNYHGKARAKPNLVAEWNKTNPGKAFPAWGDFTGIASTGHGPRVPIKVEKCCEHEATTSLAAEGYTTPNAELYNNFYVNDNVKPLLTGTQMVLPRAIAQKRHKKQPLTEAEKKVKPSPVTSNVMWVVPQGKSKVIGLSLGHGIQEWQQTQFQGLLKDSVNFLCKK